MSFFRNMAELYSHFRKELQPLHGRLQQKVGPKVLASPQRHKELRAVEQLSSDPTRWYQVEGFQCVISGLDTLFSPAKKADGG